MEDRDNPSEIGVSCYIHAQEWDLEPYVESEVTLAANEEDYSPALQIRGLASRKYSFFLWNIIIIMVYCVFFSSNRFNCSGATTTKIVCSDYVLITILFNLVTFVIPSELFLTYMLNSEI